LLQTDATGSVAASKELGPMLEPLRGLAGAIVDFPAECLTNGEAVERVRVQTGVNIDADWESLQSGSVRRDDRFAARARRQTALAALDRALELPEPWRRPAWTVSNGHVVVVPSGEGLSTALLAVYDAADFGERNPGAPDVDVYKEVQDIVTGCVATEQWVDNGGDRASVMWWRSKMVIRAGPRIHMEVQELLAKMRAASGNLRRLEESAAR
jgi:hypothetical protein